MKRWMAVAQVEKAVATRGELRGDEHVRDAVVAGAAESGGEQCSARLKVYQVYSRGVCERTSCSTTI